MMQRAADGQRPDAREDLPRVALTPRRAPEPAVEVLAPRDIPRRRLHIDGAHAADQQGLTLVHYSAQRKHSLWDTLGV